jgi:HSP20 family protein
MPHLFREARDLADDVRRVFEELERQSGAGSVSGECVPAVDVVETADAIQIVVDLPGVRAESVRVLVKGNTILIAGEKPPAACPARDASFHLVERGFGRFARVIRLAGAFDASRAQATLRAGELRLALPRIEDRRGRGIPVPVTPIEPPA